MISKCLQILNLQPRISKVFLDHYNIFEYSFVLFISNQSLLDLRNLQNKLKILLPKTFTVWTNCSSDLKIFANSQPSASNFKKNSRSLEQFFLTVGDTIYFSIFTWYKPDSIQFSRFLQTFFVIYSFLKELHTKLGTIHIVFRSAIFLLFWPPLLFRIHK